MATPQFSGFVKVRGAREHNLKNINVDIPRNALVVFTGISGSGKSSLAFGTLYAEAQRRYLESVSPYARRLFNQMAIPEVDEIEGLPPAVALQQQRGTVSARSSVGSVTTLSNLLRMLYSRAGDYPPGQSIIYAEGFSPNTPEGACPQCHGLGNVYAVTEESMVPDPNLTIRERAIAAWPTAWQGQNLREILMTLGYDVDKPWKDLPKKDRDWILFTEEQPTVPVYSGFTQEQMQRALKQKLEPSYMGTFTGAKRYVLQTFANTQSALMKKRVAQYMISSECPTCHGKRLKPESLAVRFAGYDIADLSRLPLKKLHELFKPFAAKSKTSVDSTTLTTQRIAEDMVARLEVMLDLGLGYLTVERGTPTLSPGELQRLRLATQVRSNLFGVIYVLDEPSAGLHPADTEALLRALDKLKAAGNSLFIVEHEIEVIRHADWIVDVGPRAGSGGGQILYSGEPEGLKEIEASITRQYIFRDQPSKSSEQSLQPFEQSSQPLEQSHQQSPQSSEQSSQSLEQSFQSLEQSPQTHQQSPQSHQQSLISHRQSPQSPRTPKSWLSLKNITRNNLKNLDVDFPLGVFTSVTGVSGSGKSSLVSQVLVELVAGHLGLEIEAPADEAPDLLQDKAPATISGKITQGMQAIKRLVQVDQKAIGRTPRSNLATYTGLFDHVRKIFAATRMAKARKYDAGSFSFNVAKGRCPHCQGEGFVMVELLFLPSVYAPCPTCQGTRYNHKILEVQYKGKNIAEVLNMTVDEAWHFFEEDKTVAHALDTVRQVGLGYIRLGQPATELSGGEAQRIKLATELQRTQHGNTLYILDEPTTGLHPSDVEKLMTQLDGLVAAGNTVIVVEHDMDVITHSDWIIDIGPGAGDQGGNIVAAGPPQEVAKSKESITAKYIRRSSDFH